jgi:hypothetical protein
LFAFTGIFRDEDLSHTIPPTFLNNTASPHHVA